MSSLADVRADLVDVLNGVDGVRAVAVVPQTFTPPICWVTSGVPYRQRAQAVGSKKVNLAVVCLGGMATNSAAADATDDLAELVANAIDKSDNYALDPAAEMDQPRLYPTGQGQQMLGIAVNVFTVISRG